MSRAQRRAAAGTKGWIASLYGAEGGRVNAVRLLLMSLLILASPAGLSAGGWPKWVLPKPDTVTAKCTLDRDQIEIGSKIPLRAKVEATDSKEHPLAYVWSGNGGRITGVGPEVTVDASGLNPGRYSVDAMTQDSFQNKASCIAEFEVLAPPDSEKASSATTGSNLAAGSVGTAATPPVAPSPTVPPSSPAPPAPIAAPAPPAAADAEIPPNSTIAAGPVPSDSVTMTCTTSPGVVEPGKQASVAAEVKDVPGQSLHYFWFTNGGTILGQGSQVRVDTSELIPGTYTITGRVEDDQGGASDCTTTVQVEIPVPPPAPPQLLNIAQIVFPRNRDTLGGSAQAQLQKVVGRLMAEPAARVSLESYAGPDESAPGKLADARADAVKRYLLENGVAEARVRTLVGTGGRRGGLRNRTLDVIWLPEGLEY